MSAAWIAVSAYALLLLGLAARGALRTRSVEAFAVGNRDVPPALIGLALVAQLTSVATFVINPGLVFHSGIAALMGFGLAAAAGITTGLVVFSARFRRMGSQVQALTLPGWIAARHGSEGLRAGFSLLSLGLVAYAVLIVVALALVLSGLLGVTAVQVVPALVLFVSLCVVLGGANTSAWTNAVQAVVMLVVAVILIGAGLPLLGDGLLDTIRAQDPALLGITNPSSLYFRNLFEVFVCNFAVGVALVCQPHIVGKVLGLRDDKQVRTYLGVAVVAGLVFLGVLAVGLYARATVDPATRVDLVVPTWIAATFPGWMQVVISLGLLSAGLSTLEGILGALAAIAAIDVHRLLGIRRIGGLAFGRLALVGVGLVTAALSWHQLANPTGGTVAIFAQYGVYGFFTAAFFPMACGMFLPRVGRGAVIAGVVGALATYLGLAWTQAVPLANNPAVLATWGLACGAGATMLASLPLPAARRSDPAT
jgi:sodium/pantothenate symporter